MSNIADITVFDGAATPVSHTLKAISVARKGNTIEAYWREALVSLPTYAQVSVKMELETLKSGVMRCSVEVQVPVMESVSGVNASGYTAAPKVAYVDRAKYEQFSHPRANITGRRLARQLLVNVMGNVATSVAPVSTGFAPELVDQLIAAT